MAQESADERNLVFAVLAFRVELIDQTQLREAVVAWTIHKERPIGEILVEQGALSPELAAMMEPLVAAHLSRHGDDPRESLRSLSSLSPIIESLAGLTDPMVEATVSYLQTTEFRSDEARRPGESQSTLPSAREIQIGGQRFRVLRLHRRGGMGEVYTALDQELGRIVALKEMQERYADRPESRSRFVLEAEIAGNLEHPSIVPVYGLGAHPDGSPFYAMRFVEGDNLSKAIVEYHQAAKTLSRVEQRVGLRKLLGRFLDVCDAMSYAHSRGVLHRDLKPSNVMLGRFGETLLVDWGLAKATGRKEPGALPSQDDEGRIVPSSSISADYSVAGRGKGTPGYMSPEQARGELEKLGPSTDVFSLGAILHAIVTGRRPGSVEPELEPDTPTEAHSAGAASSPPPSPPGALLAICQKAMAEHTQDRYPNVRAMADDVERWLADEPLLIYRDPFTLRLTRWGRRHRSLVASGTALGLTAILALGIGLWRVSAEQARTERQYVRAEQLRVKAEANVQNLITLSDRVLDLSEQRLSQIDGAEDVRKAMFQEVVDAYERLRAEYPENLKLKAEAAVVRSYLANVHRLLNELGPSRLHYAESIALLEEYLKTRPDDRENTDRLAEVLREWATLLQQEGKLGEARAALERTLQIAREQSQADPASTDFQRTVANTLLELGELQTLLGDHSRAVATLNESVKLYRALLAGRETPLRPLDPLLLTLALLNAAQAQRESGNLPAARSLHEESVEKARRLVASNPDDNNARYSLARALLEMGRTEARRPETAAASLPIYAESVAAWTRLREDFGDVPIYREFEAISQLWRAEALRALGQLDAAEADAASANSTLRSLIEQSEGMPRLLGLLGDTDLGRARIAIERDDGPAAIDLLRQAIESLQAAQTAAPEVIAIRRSLQAAIGLLDSLTSTRP